MDRTALWAVLSSDKWKVGRAVECTGLVKSSAAAETLQM